MNQADGSKLLEIQELLNDERDRCNQYKQLYQTLKDRHSKLRDELQFIQDTLKEVTSRNERQRSSDKSLVQQLEERVSEQQTEIKFLSENAKSFDEKKVRISAVDETSNYYESQLKALHSEKDKLREQYNSLHYENSILKCKFEGRESEYSHTLERINVQHITELEELQTKIETLENQKFDPPETYAVELKSSKRDVLELQSRVKVILSECEELRVQNENLSLQLCSVNKTNMKQTSDNLSNLRSLEFDKQKVEMEKDILVKELSNAQEHRKVLTNELQGARREVLTLRSKLEESEHRFNVMSTNARVEAEKGVAEKESLKEHYLEELTRMKSDLQSVNENFAKEQKVMLEKDQELQHNFASMRQQFYKESREAYYEKEKLEQKAKNLEAENERLAAHFKKEMHTMELELNSCLLAKAELEKQLATIRNGIPTQSFENIVSTSKHNINYEKEIQDIKTQIHLLTSDSSARQGEKLPNSSQKPNDGHMSEHEVAQMKLEWEQQKLQFRQRLEELESQLRNVRNSNIEEKRDLEFKIKQYTKQIAKLRGRIELHKAENEELQTCQDVFETYVSPEEHSRVKNQLVVLQKKLDQFKILISTDPNAISKKLPSERFPDSLLSDIKNTDFRKLHSHTEKDEGLKIIHKKTVEQVVSPKKVQPRRKSLKERDRRRHMNILNPVVSSSSDLDMENL